MEEQFAGCSCCRWRGDAFCACSLCDSPPSMQGRGLHTPRRYAKLTPTHPVHYPWSYASPPPGSAAGAGSPRPRCGADPGGGIHRHPKLRRLTIRNAFLRGYFAISVALNTGTLPWSGATHVWVHKACGCARNADVILEGVPVIGGRVRRRLDINARVRRGGPQNGMIHIWMNSCREI